MVNFPIPHSLEKEFPVDNHDDATAIGFAAATAFLNFVSLFSVLTN